MQLINFSTAIVLLTSVLSGTALPVVPVVNPATAAAVDFKVKVIPERLFHYHGGPFMTPKLEEALDTARRFKNKLTGTPEPPPYRVFVTPGPGRPHA